MDEHELRRLTMRSWRRGMRETDLLLGRFADRRLAGLAEAERADYAALLEENDQDIYAWIVAAHDGRAVAPARFRALIAAIAAQAAEWSLENPSDSAASPLTGDSHLHGIKGLDP